MSLITGYEVGTTVYLNSGSPKLTVINDHNNENITVTWMDDKNSRQQLTAPKVCFTKENPNA